MILLRRFTTERNAYKFATIGPYESEVERGRSGVSDGDCVTVDYIVGVVGKGIIRYRVGGSPSPKYGSV